MRFESDARRRPPLLPPTLRLSLPASHETLLLDLDGSCLLPRPDAATDSRFGMHKCHPPCGPTDSTRRLPLVQRLLLKYIVTIRSCPYTPPNSDMSGSNQLRNETPVQKVSTQSSLAGAVTQPSSPAHQGANKDGKFTPHYSVTKAHPEGSKQGQLRL
ncbi:hypothetical protein FIBSPDRAFT_1045602 [Athelia psychrophila]|uniref:Uncharacterized protein n=1 Tax=Athelia psychrophila TaxID=1759441 RepID=A0A166I0D2_9AGAM|nr:hypothetical protein FIBSPDRAFT_1045602 [Fibularhizoctonia sp. CBS 109695]